ncbi:MAG: adenine deaminase, partial [Aestuariivirgaceae bacterium]
MAAVKPWSETAPQLIDVCMGRLPADLVIRNGRWVNVYSGEIIPSTDIAIVAGRIAFAGEDAGHTIGERTQIVEAEGRYL